MLYLSSFYYFITHKVPAFSISKLNPFSDWIFCQTDIAVTKQSLNILFPREIGVRQTSVVNLSAKIYKKILPAET